MGADGVSVTGWPEGVIVGVGVRVGRRVAVGTSVTVGVIVDVAVGSGLLILIFCPG